MASSARRSPSPASFYDMSDDEEGEYNTIRHAESGKGVKLLYTKSKVRDVFFPLVAYFVSNLRRSTCILRRPPKTTSQAS
jgi:hypothetical protein